MTSTEAVPTVSRAPEPFLGSKAFDYLRLLPALGRVPLPVAYRLARARGRWYYRRRPAIVARIVRNAGEALGLDEAAARLLAQRVFEQHSLEELEVQLLRGLQAADAPRLARFEGLADLEAARNRRCGVVLLVSHFGSMPLSVALLGLQGYPIHGIAGPYGPPHTDPVDTAHIGWKVHGIERCTGVPFLFVGRAGGLQYRQVLKAGRLVALAIDASLGEPARLPVRFLGRTAWFATSALRLARATGAAVFPHWTVREPDGIRNAIHVEPFPLPALETEDDYHAALQTAVDLFERCVRAYPDHWSHIDTPASWATLDQIWASPPSP